MSNSKLVLRKGRDLSVSRRHPWIFSRGIYTDTGGLVDGAKVEVYANGDRLLATGHFQHGSIAVRILSFSGRTIDMAFYQDRIHHARENRILSGLPSPDTTAYRLIHGEGDMLPGLIIDIYDTVAVIQAHSIGMYLDLPLITEALQLVMGDQISTIYSKSGSTLPSNYSSQDTDRVLWGADVTTIAIRENGITFPIDFVGGQKTGFFLDQRDNRRLLGKYAMGKSVLNCFCYTGGFSMYALAGGSTSVDSVDISDKAIASLNQLVRDTGYDDIHRGLSDNVLKYLTKEYVPTYDIVVVDPPAFAKRINKRHNAIQAYKRLNAMAISKIAKNGLLFTFSCSQVVDNQMFYDTIVAACIESGREAQVLHRLSQGSDHPVNIFHPEGNYLKGLVLRIL